MGAQLNYQPADPALCAPMACQPSPIGFRVAIDMLTFKEQTMTKWLLIALLAPASAGQAQDFRLESAGARFGFSTKQRTHTFNQAEGFADFNLPSRLDLGSDWRLQTRLDLSAGWLGAGNDDALVSSVGPSLVLGHGHFPLRLDLGFSPTVISSHEFGSVDLGTAAEFT